MIIKAKVVWEVPVTLDVLPTQVPPFMIKQQIFMAALEDLKLREAKITECIELPEIVDKAT